MGRPGAAGEDPFVIDGTEDVMNKGLPIDCIASHQVGLESFTKTARRYHNHWKTAVLMCQDALAGGPMAHLMRPSTDYSR